VNGGNVLTAKTLAIIENGLQATAYDRMVIYGEWCRIGESRLKQKNMEFKQTPYDVKKR
jgi:adenine-specific DNA-methyltransferase